MEPINIDEKEIEQLIKPINNYYVKNKDLLVEIAILQETKKFSPQLGKYIFSIVEGLSHRPNFNGYTYIDDMRSEAHVAVIRGLKNFKLEKSSNPFSYITQIAWNAFIAHINKEKRKAKTKKHLFDLKEEIQETDAMKAIDYSTYASYEITVLPEDRIFIEQEIDYPDDEENLNYKD